MSSCMSKYRFFSGRISILTSKIISGTWEAAADGEERRKGEEVWLEMWERERGDKVIKKETEEEEEEEEEDKVCKNTIQNHDQEILQVNSNQVFNI